MEEVKRIWLTLSTVKQDLANVRRHAATPTYTYENVHQANSSNKSFSLLVLIAINFFVNVSKEESLRALGCQSDRETRDTGREAQTNGGHEKETVGGEQTTLC